ncbi:MAG: 50S ribosomal protein L29 [Candidatus Nezhaarchaeales archaeon]
MAILRLNEIRKMSPEERVKKLSELYAELLRLRAMVASGGSVENPGRIKALKRTIARILTINREEELKKARREKG